MDKKVLTDLDHSDTDLCTGYKSNHLDLCELCAVINGLSSSIKMTRIFSGTKTCYYLHLEQNVLSGRHICFYEHTGTNN